MCSLCNKEGHLDKDCPQDCLPQLEELPEMTENWRAILDCVTIQIMGLLNLKLNKKINKYLRLVHDESHHLRIFFRLHK